MLILEILTLLVCIVTFAPLSNAASNAFIFTIALTALLLLLIPLILTFISGFKGDKAEHEIKRDKERQAAVVRQPGPRNRSHSPQTVSALPKLLVLAICPGSFLLSFLVLYFTKNHQDQLAVLLLRQLFMALAGTAFLSVIPLFAVLGELLRDIFGSACVSLGKPALLYRLQRQYGSAGGICLCPSPAGRVFFGKTLYPYPGNIYRKTKDAYGTHQKSAFSKTLRIPRTFSVEQERILLDFL